MSADLEHIRAARAALATHYGPDSPQLRTLLAQHRPIDAAELLATATPAAGSLPGELVPLHAGHQLDAAGASRIVIPEDDEWPTGLADLAQTAQERETAGVRAALCLWVRGERSLAETLAASVAIAGSRAASPYGVHVAGELGRDLADNGWTVVAASGYGVAYAALQAALAVPGRAVALLPCGLDIPYPAAIGNQLRALARDGLLLSAYPPGALPERNSFITTTRLLGALTQGSVLVEAAQRSTSMSTLEQTLFLGRPAMVVPGPVTSLTSAGCHAALRGYPQTRLVTDVADILDELPPPHRKTFDVTVSRTEVLTFRVEADDAADAEHRYLGDGDEIASETSSLEVDSIEEAPPGSRIGRATA